MADKLKDFIKNKNNRILALILILGVILTAFGSTADRKEISGGGDETRAEKILNNTYGIGRTRVYINYGADGKKDTREILSVIVLVENDDLKTKRLVSEITSAVLDVPIHRIKVLREK